MRTQVGIIGAGPAGLLLSHLLAERGIDSVVLEGRSREYVEGRIRAGVLEHGTADTLIEAGVGDRMQREGLVHEGIELRFGRTGHRIPLTERTGRTITVYGQQEVVKDLIDGRLDAGGTVLFEAEATSIEGIEGPSPTIHFRHGGEDVALSCDVVAGCDGFHGIARPSLPAHVRAEHERSYPLGWLGIVAEVPPSTDELIYAYDDEVGFALHSLRSPELSRLYIQCDPDDDPGSWPDETVWEELHRRLANSSGWALKEGPVIEKSVAPLRSFVTEPMQHGRLFLAGDAAHIVPPTGAKGLNLAVADVRVLTRALTAWYREGREDLLAGYSEQCLDRIWRVQQFSWWMTQLLHRSPHDDAITQRLRHAQLRELVSSTAAQTLLAENYVGLPMPPLD